MPTPSGTSFTELLITLLLGALAGAATEGLSGWTKQNVERLERQKVVLIAKSGPVQVRCDTQDHGSGLASEPQACWSTRFHLARRGSGDPVPDLDLKVSLPDSSGDASLLNAQSNTSPAYIPPKVIDNSPSGDDPGRFHYREWNIKGFREPQEIDFQVISGTAKKGSDPQPTLSLNAADPSVIVRTSEELWWVSPILSSLLIFLVLASLSYALFARSKLHGAERQLRALQDQMGTGA